MTSPIDITALTATLDAFGGLTIRLPDGRFWSNVEPVRCFPYSDPENWITLVDDRGKELTTIERMDQLPAAARDVVRTELARRTFVPAIRRIAGSSNPSPPCTWDVETDRGAAKLRIESEDDVRRLADGSVVIADAGGVRYRILEPNRLDAASRRLLRRVN